MEFLLNAYISPPEQIMQKPVISNGNDRTNRFSLTIVIVAYENYNLLESCIGALTTQRDNKFKILVVDNTPLKNRRVINSWDRKIKFVYTNKNLGFAGGVNFALDYVDTEWLVTLNTDAEPNSDWISELKAAVQRYPDTKIFGSKQIMAENHDKLDGFGDAYSIYGIPWRGGFGQPASLGDSDIEVIAPCAAAALYNTKVIRELGGFDVRFFCYLEDVDLGLRARAAGYRVIQLSKAIVYHLDGGTSGRKSPFTLYHSFRNRVWLFAKTMPLTLILLFSPLFVALNVWFILREPEKEKVFPSLQGLRDGIIQLPKIILSDRGKEVQKRLTVSLAINLLSWNPMQLRRKSIVRLKSDIEKQNLNKDVK